jgi:hypothetical protein
LRFYARGGFFRLYPFLICSAKFAYKAINALPRRVPILAASNSYFLTWQGARRILYRGIEGLEGRYLAAIGVSVPQGQDERRAESKSLQVEIWKKHIGLQRQVERTRGVPAYFFSSAQSVSSEFEAAVGRRSGDGDQFRRRRYQPCPDQHPPTGSPGLGDQGSAGVRSHGNFPRNTRDRVRGRLLSYE